MPVIMHLRVSGCVKWKQICFHVLLILTLTLFKQSGSQVKIYHNHFALHIPDGPEEAESIAQKHGFTNRGQIGNVENHFLFEHHSIKPRWTNYSLDHHKILDQEPGVRWFEQQHEKKRVKRDIHSLYMPDPMFKDQWFLNHGAIDGSDMNVQPAWMKGYTGKRVVVTILDDGIQSDHPDLKLNYDPLASTDINGNDDDPMPQDNNDNKHGTRCAGEVAAEAFNSICGVGVAYNASIGGVRMLDGLVNDAVEARALSLRPDHIDIYSASWGPEDDGKTVDGPGPLAKKAFINGVKYGRNGKGSIFVWASGNGGRRVDNCNCDGYTNSIFTLSISSASQGGKKPWYLEECSSTLATTYSSGTPGHDASIATVDQDAKLRPDKICTASHTGTSASAPIAAGVCALALEANPNLTWRDMQHIVVLTSNPDPLMVESGWKTNAVGRKYSHKFGYGLMDANAMVEVAKVWPGSGSLAICETDTITLDQPIPSDPTRVARASMKTNACGQTSSEIRYLEHVQCKLSLHYHPRGALQIVLTSPSGTKSSLLLPRPRDTTNSGFEDWPFLSVHFWGEPANGTWTIEVNHSPSVKGTSQSKGVLKKWKMLFYGTRESPLKDPSLVSEFGSFLGEDTSQDSKMMDESVDVLGNEGQHISWSSGSLSSYPYLHNHSRLLESKEPLNQYDVSSSSSEFDLASSIYRSCHPQCKGNQCSGPKATQCLACKSFKFGNVCVDRCPLTTYSSVRGTCQACHPSCQTCFGPNPNNCLSCENSLFLLTNQSTCIESSCPLGYRQRSSSNECVPCPSHCESCTEASEVLNLIERPGAVYSQTQETSVVCLKCQDGLVRSVLENKCLSSCLGGFYLNQETKACDPCHESCATCTGSLPTQCSLCQEHTYYFERKCVETCPIGFRPDVYRQECVPCPQGCGKCTSDQKCIKCQEEWTFAYGEQVCIPEITILCRKGSFRADDNANCQPCSPNCRSCAETKDNCLTCPMNLALHLFTCIDHECPVGTFHDKKMRECRPCPHVCTECESFNHCTKCHLGHALTARGHCATSCKPEEYQTSEQQCRPCHGSCLTCQGPTDKDCLSCPAANKYLGPTGQCLDQCSRGFVDEKGQCQACHPSCSSCHGPSSFQCSTCSSGRKLGPDGTCQSCEPRKFYDGYSNECLLCHESCGTCSGPQDSDCSSCHVPLVLDTWNGTCVPCCQSLDESHCCACSASKEKCLKPSKKILSRKRSSVRISLSDEVLSNPSRSVFLYGSLLTCLVVMSLLVVRYFKRGKLLGRPSLNGVGRRRPRRRRQSSQDLSRTNYQKLLTEEDLAGGINVNRPMSKKPHTCSISDLDQSDDDLDQMGSIPKRPRYLDDHLPLQPRKYYPIEKVEMSKELFKRRVQIRTDELIRHGREQIPRRSDFLEWNYDSELYAFSVRLGEKFDDSKIREAFVDQSHVEMEAERHRALEMGSEDEFTITSNDRLAEVGSTFLAETLESYVRVAFPFWPEEGVQALVAFLNSTEVQAEISFHIGTRDLIFAKDYPPDMPTYAKVFRALVGVLIESGDEDQAKRFVYDLVVPQLHVQDINEIWDIKDPMRLLMTILRNEGKSEPESRLLWVSGLDTIMACYHVGIYVDKELIGQGPGESADIAEEMATRDALRRMFRSDESMPMIPMGDYLDPNQIKAGPKTNLNASEWSQENVLKNLQTI